MARVWARAPGALCPTPTSAFPRARGGNNAHRHRPVEKSGATFEFEEEMGVDVALDPDLRKLYPFCRLTGPANVLVMPRLHASSISTKLIQRFGAASSIGPVLIGLDKPVQIVGMDAGVADIVQMALMAAHASTPKLL